MTTFTKPHQWCVKLRLPENNNYATIEVTAPTAADALVMAPLQYCFTWSQPQPVVILNIEYIPERPQ
jgi:hypothetical protein